MPAPAQQSPKSSKNATKVAVGVGVPVAALVLGAVVGFVFWRERRLKNWMREEGQARRGQPELLLSDINAGQSENFMSRFNASTSAHGPHEVGITSNTEVALEMPDETMITRFNELSSNPR